jgi:hypothetical protein
MFAYQTLKYLNVLDAIVFASAKMSQINVSFAPTAPVRKENDITFVGSAWGNGRAVH